MIVAAWQRSSRCIVVKMVDSYGVHSERNIAGDLLLGFTSAGVTFVSHKVIYLTDDMGNTINTLGPYRG